MWKTILIDRIGDDESLPFVDIRDRVRSVRHAVQKRIHRRIGESVTARIADGIIRITHRRVGGRIRRAGGLPRAIVQKPRRDCVVNAIPDTGGRIGVARSVVWIISDGRHEIRIVRYLIGGRTRISISLHHHAINSVTDCLAPRGSYIHSSVFPMIDKADGIRIVSSPRVIHAN